MDISSVLSFDYLAALFVFATAATITPGPNNVMIMASGLNYGVKRSLPHMLGICVGFPIMVIFVGFGLGVIFTAWPLLHDLIKIAGIAYLLYLSWLIAHSESQSLEGSKSKPFSFLQAALFQWVNPKAWVMATGAIAAFSSSGADVYLQTLAIAVVFFLIAFPCVGAWLYFGLWMKNILKSPQHQKRFNVAMASLLALSVVPAAWEVVASVI